MGVWLGIVFWILFILSSWMTASAFASFRSLRQRDEDMNNLYEQVLGAVRAGDLPRAILLLEGEPGPLAMLLSSILTEATKFTPKLRVAYKVTLESQKRRSQVRQNPLRVVSYFAPVFGILGFLSPLVSLIAKNPQAWMAALWIFVISVVIAGISYAILKVTERQDRESIVEASEFGRRMLNFLLGPESPLQMLRGQSFPSPQ